MNPLLSVLKIRTFKQNNKFSYWNKLSLSRLFKLKQWLHKEILKWHLSICNLRQVKSSSMKQVWEACNFHQDVTVNELVHRVVVVEYFYFRYLKQKYRKLIISVPKDKTEIISKRITVQILDTRTLIYNYIHKSAQ